MILGMFLPMLVLFSMVSVRYLYLMMATINARKKLPVYPIRIAGLRA